MKQQLLLRVLTLLFALAALQNASAQGLCALNENGDPIGINGGECVNTIVTGVPFLRITPNARNGALGDAGIAVSPDASAMHFNASKLAFVEDKLSVEASYTPWLRSLGLNDVYLAYMSGYYNIDDLQTMGFSLRFFSLGDIQFTDENGEPLAIGRPNEFEVAFAYSRKLAERFSAGVTAKFIYSNLAAGQSAPGGEVIETGTAGAADISFTYQAPIDLQNGESNLRLGLAVSNIGSKITYTASTVRDFLPANLGIGGAWEIDFDQYNRLTFTTDVNKLLVPTPCVGPDCDEDNNGIEDYREESPIGAIFSSFGDAPGGFSEEMQELMYSFGLEYWYDEQFAVRAGYFNEHVLKGNRKYLTVGLGLKYNIFGLDFSYLVPTTNQRNPLDNTLRFSLAFDFAELDN